MLSDDELHAAKLAQSSDNTLHRVSDERFLPSEDAPTWIVPANALTGRPPLGKFAEKHLLAGLAVCWL